MDENEVGNELALPRDAREESFLPKEVFEALPPEARERMRSLARENSELRGQNTKLIDRIAAPVVNGNGHAEPAKDLTPEEEIRDVTKFPTKKLWNYKKNSLATLRALAAAEPGSEEHKALREEAVKIDHETLELTERELIRREALEAVRPEMERDRADKGADELGRSLFAPVISKWGTGALSDEKSELFKLAQGFYNERLSLLGGPSKVDKATQLMILRWSFDTADGELSRAGVTPLRSRGRLEDMDGVGVGGSAQPGSAAQVASQVLALHKQGKSAEAHRLDLQRVLEDRSYRPVFGRS